VSLVNPPASSVDSSRSVKNRFSSIFSLCDPWMTVVLVMMQQAKVGLYDVSSYSWL
jgi:hypothetical protein